MFCCHGDGDRAVRNERTLQLQLVARRRDATERADVGSHWTMIGRAGVARLLEELVIFLGLKAALANVPADKLV